jgi:hypothetical protein
MSSWWTPMFLKAQCVFEGQAVKEEQTSRTKDQLLWKKNLSWNDKLS